MSSHVVLNFEIDISSRFNVVVYQEFAYVFFLYFGEIIQFVMFFEVPRDPITLSDDDWGV